MSKLRLFLVTYLGLHSLALPVFGSFRYLTLAYSISDEDSLSEIALSGASKLASTYFTLFYRSVHVLYTGIQCSPHDSTKLSPNYLMFGRKLGQTADLLLDPPRTDIVNVCVMPYILRTLNTAY